MKNFLFFVLAIVCVGFMTSCDKEDVLSATDETVAQIVVSSSKTTLEEGAVPAEITSFVETQFPNNWIEQVRLADGLGYEVWLDDYSEVFFSTDGTFLREGAPEGRHGRRGNFGETIALEDLPAVVTDYVMANYPEATIDRARLGDRGYLLGLDTGISLLFDTEGNFEGERTCGGDGGNRGESIAIEDLPAAITDYVTVNYPEATIEKAKVYSDGYKVKLDDGTRLAFDIEGNLLEV
ncbi:MAG: PepSY-like domain-containing protein [Chitinophagales bacterium]